MEFGKKMTTPPEDEPKADWDPDEVLTRAQQMMRLKESIYMKAHATSSKRRTSITMTSNTQIQSR